jgi:hypothetical protein
MKSGIDEWSANIGQNRRGDVIESALEIPSSQLSNKIQGYDPI